MKSDFKQWVFVLVLGLGISSIFAAPYVLNNDLLSDGVFYGMGLSGTKVIALTVNGQQIDMGTGADDYLESNGTGIDTPGWFEALDFYGTAYYDTAGAPAHVIGTGLESDGGFRAVRIGANENATATTTCLLDVGKNYQSGASWTSGACFRTDGSLAFGPNSVLTHSATAPTTPVACTSPSITHGLTTSFQADVGTTCAGISTFVVTLPTAVNGWDCHARHKTVAAAAAAALECAGDTTTGITCTNFSRTTGLALAFTNADDLVISCVGR